MSLHPKVAITSISLNRELRRVPANWEHPKDTSGKLIPLFQDLSLKQSQENWDQEEALWNKGFVKEDGDTIPLDDEKQKYSYADWVGERPDEDAYMPSWEDEQRTHFQLYEITSEGTPMTPVMESLEVMASWLANNDASAYAGITLDKEEWLSALQSLDQIA